MKRMRLIAVGVVSIVGLAWVWTKAAEKAAAEWTSLSVPGTWEELAPKQFGKYDGFAWYRCEVLVPADWKGLELQLSVEKVDNAHEAYFNGRRIGGTGSFPPKYESGLSGEASVLPGLRELCETGREKYDRDSRL